MILPKDVDTKFRFITVAAQRAKQLQDGAKPRVETRSRKPTRVAVEEMLARRGLVGDPRRRDDAPWPGPTARPERGSMPMVVLGVTGCIGAYKACEVLRELQKRDVDVHVVMTEAATRFVAPLTFEALSHHPVFYDQWALGERRRHPAHQPRRRGRPAAGGARHRQHPRQVRPRHRRRRAQHAVPRHPGAGARGPGHEREHVRAPRGAGEPRRSCAARGVGVVEPGLGLSGLRLAGQGAAGRGRGHRGRGHGGPGAAPRPRRARPCS